MKSCNRLRVLDIYGQQLSKSSLLDNQAQNVSYHSLCLQDRTAVEVCTTIGTFQVNKKMDKGEFSGDISAGYLFVRLFPRRTWARKNIYLCPNSQILCDSVRSAFHLKQEFKSAWGTLILFFKFFSSMTTKPVVKLQINFRHHEQIFNGYV